MSKNDSCIGCHIFKYYQIDTYVHDKQQDVQLRPGCHRDDRESGESFTREQVSVNSHTCNKK